MATMQDVADRAGVSIATVSYVVNGTKNVSPPTRARIEAAMDELRYRRNVVARALASSRTHIVALLHPVLGNRLGGTVMGFVIAASNGARARGYDLVLWPVEDEEQMSHLLAGGLVDGALLMEVRVHDPRVDELVTSSVPFALIGRTHDETLPFVDIDFAATIDTAMRHLTDLGHQAIALVDGNDETGWVADLGPTVRTEAAYREHMTAVGGRSVVISVPPNAAGGIEAARRLRDEAPEVTAILLMNEQAATGLVRGCASSGAPSRATSPSSPSPPRSRWARWSIPCSPCSRRPPGSWGSWASTRSSISSRASTPAAGRCFCRARSCWGSPRLPRLARAPGGAGRAPGRPLSATDPAP
ncbi:hypothetical protein GCM10025881_33190 [Pseudolysinimonas kribbensis]|uniref:HTH lacI-type domain-containing protein n=1 Tax=Pseudolysinimonas kribbensis TaxID=433641 RepID=A0ABQ6K774_9MICO|nr:LacI family DNA-binding transcriptional regulator [Pseudolysinimonas kribbensis]GMA96495.1 hypothetical protein GCM10025881_33190 [Pseudolysinimonas kribbensis]